MRAPSCWNLTCRFVLFLWLIPAILAGTARTSAAQGCSISDEFDADRPDVTNSPIAVPRGSFQAEDGVTWTAENRSDVFDGAETLLRAGVANCTELDVQLPTYFYSMNGHAASGFDDVVVSFKRQLPDFYGFVTSAAGGLEFPTGSNAVSDSGYDPYIQGSWSREISDDWSLAGMFTLAWLTSGSASSPSFQSTFEVEHDLTSSVDSFLEYVGDYPNHSRPAQIVDAGATWEIAKRQAVDFHFGFGLNSGSPNHFFGFGYSFRLDGLF
jgi:outer membrane putative beta-barrel porin/alpha-amylase